MAGGHRSRPAAPTPTPRQAATALRFGQQAGQAAHAAPANLPAQGMAEVDESSFARF
jgi:hypothetical protein